MQQTAQSELIIQCLYGRNWEDLQEAIDENHAHYILDIVKSNRPEAKFRILQKFTHEKIIKEI